jgi:Domain of unknown function (DUF397)
MANDFSCAAWRKSSYTGNKNCVELAHLPGLVGVRDSKDPDGPVLVFTAREMRGLLDRLKAGPSGVAGRVDSLGGIGR